MKYALKAEFSADNGIDTVENYLRELMQEEGFGVLTEIDVQAVLKEKLDLDKEPYRILGFCNPPRANRVLDSDGDIGLFLPCNGVVYKQGEKIKVALTNAEAMFQMIDNDEVEPVAMEVTEIFQRVHDRLVAKFGTN